jgi:hypothetical protein
VNGRPGGPRAPSRIPAAGPPTLRPPFPPKLETLLLSRMHRTLYVAVGAIAAASILIALGANPFL